MDVSSQQQVLERLHHLAHAHLAIKVGIIIKVIKLVKVIKVTKVTKVTKIIKVVKFSEHYFLKNILI